MARTRLEKTSPSAPHTSLWFTLLKRDVSPGGKKSQNRTVPNWSHVVGGAGELLVLGPDDCVGELDFFSGFGRNFDIPGDNAGFFV